MIDGARMQVEVVLAMPTRQTVHALDLPAGATVADALARAGIDIAAWDGVGIWGRIVTPDQPLRDGDRVELYRPLQADPKVARRRRAAR